MLKSNAQNFEDVVLHRALRSVVNGFYIDIGAQDPNIDSVSLAFHEIGWRGVHVEPSHFYAEKLRRARPGDEVIQAAIGDPSCRMRFFEVPNTGLSTGVRRTALRHRAAGYFVEETTVQCLPLAKILEQYGDREIHWLKIDVEGMEKEVLGSWKPARARPWIVVVESIDPVSKDDTAEAWEDILMGLNYKPVYFDGVNRFYLSERHKELRQEFSLPPNIFDEFMFSENSSAPFLKDITLRLNAQRTSARQLQTVTTAVSTLRKELAKMNQLVKRQAEQSWAMMEARLAEVNSAERDRLVALKSTAQHQLRAAHRRIAELQRDLQQSSQARLRLEAQAAAGEERLKELLSVKQELSNVHHSRSWRLTQPLRSAKRPVTGLIARLISFRPLVNLWPAEGRGSEAIQLPTDEWAANFTSLSPSSRSLFQQILFFSRKAEDANSD